MDMKTFLASINLPEYLEAFEGQGFEVEDFSMMTDEQFEKCFKKVGVEKMGHQFRIMNKLREANRAPIISSTPNNSTGDISMLESAAACSTTGDIDLSTNSDDFTHCSLGSDECSEAIHKSVRDMLYTNPLSPMLVFHNEVFNSVYHTAFRKIEKVDDFRAYVTQQRTERWEMRSKLCESTNTIKRMKSGDTNNGFILKVFNLREKSQMTVKM